MNSITEKDVSGMHCRMIRAALEAGVDVVGLALVTGSKTYGRQYRLVRLDDVTGGQSDVHLLGQSRSEAYRALHAMAVSFEMVAK